MGNDQKVTTHQRFIKKFEQDLKVYFEAGDSANYVKTFSKYINFTEPTTRTEEMLYESLLKSKQHNELVDYALEQMNNGDGDYEVHMVYMLQALNDMGSYEEVLEFSSHLLEEPIPQGFRIDILSLRQHAANKLRGHYNSDREPAITAENFNSYNLFQQLEFVEQITEKNDITYVDLIIEVFDKHTRNELQTAMLLYLHSVRYNGTLTIEKCGTEMTVKPSELPPFKAYFMVEEILPEVLQEVDAFNPSFTEAATELLMGHAIYMYPLEPQFTKEAMVNAYAGRLQSMLGMEATYDVNEDTEQFLSELEREIAENSL